MHGSNGMYTSYCLQFSFNHATHFESKMMRVYENLMDVEDLSFKLELVESKAFSSRNSSANDCAII